MPTWPAVPVAATCARAEIDPLSRKPRTSAAGGREEAGTPTLRVYTDYISPACYLAEPVLARLRGDGVRVEYRAFELLPWPHAVPDFDRSEERAAWDREVAPLAAALGVPIRRPAVGVRSRKAHEAAIFARERGGFEAFHAALFRAYFVAGLDIGRIDQLCALASAVGLDGAELRVTLGVDTLAAQVVAERAEALAAGLEGAPGYVVHEADGVRTRTGWVEYERLRAWLHGAARRDS